MSKTALLHILKLLAIASAYLFLLCVLDLFFVFGADQVKGWYNNLGLLILTLPFVYSFYVYKFVKKSILLMAVAFVAGIILSYLEFMWVAIEFHTMIGGEI